MKRTSLLTMTLVGLSILSSTTAAATRYVKPTPSGTGDCSSWANACALGGRPPAPGTALALASPGDRIWVKAGTYAPFDLKEGVKIIGGFAGTESSVLQSNPATNVTIVGGGGNQRAVYGANQSASTMLRGFKIINGSDVADDKGGGGLLLSDSSALIVQCVFENNTATTHGGAAMVGGPELVGSPQFINCIFRNNGSTSTDERPYEGGAVFITTGAPVSFTNCLFHGNKAGGGGGIAKVPGTYAILTNCTMINNQATMVRGGAIRDPEGNIAIRNCILWGNTRIEAGGPPIADQVYSPGFGAQIRYSDVEGGWPGTGNINVNPLFNNPTASDYRLQSTSPCKDTGENGDIAADSGDLDWNANTLEPIPYDLGSLTRNVDASVDMGAHEIPPPSGPIGDE